ncbi:MAG: PhoH family protein [Planctomycetota bacterium]
MIPLRSHDEAVRVLGPYDRNAKLLRQSLDIEIFARAGNLRLAGNDADVALAKERIEHLLGKLRKGRDLDSQGIEEILIGQRSDARIRAAGESARSAEPRTAPGRRASERTSMSSERKGPMRAFVPRPRAVAPRGENQRRYLEMIDSHALTFGVGAAGTGKTFLAVVAAVRALREGSVRRLIVTRPVVEAGEKLGFLPGDVAAKLNPYMRPVYDSLFELIGFEDVHELEDAGVIEIAPLAYMRGRTLSHAFVILDEAQNTTIGQMKMFLTRLGEGSSMVVTGDPTQTDLEDEKKSGFLDAIRRLRGFERVGVVEFTAKDIVRHPLVEHIVRAYEAPARDKGPSEGRARP